MAQVFDNTDASCKAKKSGLKTDQTKLGLLNSALYATYGLKFKAIDRSCRYYYLDGSFDTKDTPRLPSYQTDGEIYWKNRKDTRYSTCSEKTIKEMAQRIVQDNLSERNVKVISKTLVETASDPNEKRARQLLTWIQKAISFKQLRDPKKPESIYLSAFLKKDEFLLKSDKLLLPSYLRKLGAVFAVVAHGVKNLSKAMTIASKSLQYLPNNHASPAKNYTIVNYWLRREPYHQSTSSETSSSESSSFENSLSESSSLSETISFESSSSSGSSSSESSLSSETNSSESSSSDSDIDKMSDDRAGERILAPEW
ncbi:hypothetical protein C1645_817844 [Glomus cerebriforme]|uniref:Uncharacterized protein n=1 Tax=Glomus cerebriforme TaxID=658196 RepID=A0A397TE13_9GLOM|nr:hypothetical protein C1645_817844 [Glomus cerebriforme]